MQNFGGKTKSIMVFLKVAYMALAYSALDLPAFSLLGENRGQTLYKYDLKEHRGQSPLKH